MFPNIMLHFDIGRKRSILAVEEAIKSNQLIFLVTQKDVKDDEPNKSQIYSLGVLARVKQILKQDDQSMRVLVEGKCRAEAIEYIETNKFLRAKIAEKEDVSYKCTPQIEALMRKTYDLFAQYLSIPNSCFI